MTDIETLIPLFVSKGIEFIIVGGLAGRIHGAGRLTDDVDLVYRRADENMRRIAEALAPFDPYLRGAPPGLPFIWDGETLKHGLNFTLKTKLGDVDLLGDLTPGGGYEELLNHSSEVELFGVRCLCINLERLIQIKRAVRRPKDLEALAELEAVLEEKRKIENPSR